MRLTQEQVSAIRISADEVFGQNAKVWLFGSRVDDTDAAVTLICWCVPRQPASLHP